MKFPLKKSAAISIAVICSGIFLLSASAQPPQGSAGRPSVKDPDDNYTPPITDYFTPSTAEAALPDADGFIRRWTLLDPIEKDIRTNILFTDSYVRAAFDTIYFKNQFTIVPKNGQKVKAGDKKLEWHTFDSRLYNIKLFRMASGLGKTVYGVIFWAVTVINCDDDIKDVRLAVGSNSASLWWLNGKEAVILSGDRRMVMDDCVSPRLTLKKGKNILRGAVINGPGMSDFCIRFIDGNGEPVRNITITNE